MGFFLLAVLLFFFALNYKWLKERRYSKTLSREEVLQLVVLPLALAGSLTLVRYTFKIYFLYRFILFLFIAFLLYWLLSYFKRFTK